MSQHDYIIANDTGANVRSDLNNALAAIASNNSGSSEPSTTYAFQWWYDTTNNLLKLRNSANSAWITVPFDPVNGGSQHGNNVKATFGNGDDLQIYHDGTHSYVEDAGTGNLTFKSNGASITFQSGSEYYAIFNDNGSSRLYHDGNAKFETTSTGVDVTGTVTADGLTVEGSSTSVAAIVSSTTGASFLMMGDTDANSSGQIAYNNTNNIMTFDTNGAEAMRIDSSGNVGIGTSSPNRALTVVSASGVPAELQSTSTTSLLAFYDSGTGVRPSIGSSGSNLVANVNGSERMRIDSSGNLLVGTTSLNSASNTGITAHGNRAAYLKATSSSGGDQAVDIEHMATSGTRYLVYFRINGTGIGSITSTGSSTAYNTTSDYRLKTDVQPMTGATERLKALKPVNFEWISSGERVDGFLAHEAQEVVPEAVTGTKDAMRTEEYEVTPAEYEDVLIPAVLDDEGNEIEPERTEQRLVTEAVMGEREVPDYQGIDQSKLVPLLVAAMQEQQAVIEDLTARIEALES